MSDEAQPSTTDASPTDLAELRKHVWRIDDRLFMLQEVRTQTPFTVDVLFDRLEELAAGLERFASVVDLRTVQRPDARTRAKLKERIAKINPRLVHVGLALGSNVVMRAVAKLVTFAVGFRSFGFYESVDEATEACRRALR
jgi:hypothetical protein